MARQTAGPSSTSGPGAEFECPVCGAAPPPHLGYASCPACGAPLGLREAARPSGASALHQKVLHLNQQLSDAGSQSAEDSFGLGCSLGVLLVALAGALAYWLLGGNWILTLIVVATAALFSAILAALLSLRARRGAIHRVFHTDVSREIERYLRAHRLQRAQLEEAASAGLPENAPLRIYLSVGAQPDHHKQE